MIDDWHDKKMFWTQNSILRAAHHFQCYNDKCTWRGKATSDEDKLGEKRKTTVIKMRDIIFAFSSTTTENSNIIYWSDSNWRINPGRTNEIRFWLIHFNFYVQVPDFQSKTSLDSEMFSIISGMMTLSDNKDDVCRDKRSTPLVMHVVSMNSVTDQTRVLSISWYTVAC